MRNLYRRIAGGDGAANDTGFRTAFTAAAVLLLALWVSVIGSVVTYVRVDAAWARQNAIALAQQQLEGCMRDQLEEESSLRGFLASGQRIFLDGYNAAQPDFINRGDELQRDLQKASLPDGLEITADLRTTHTLWEKDVAQPLIAAPTAPGELVRIQHGKMLSDQIRADHDRLAVMLADQSGAAQAAVKTLLLRAAVLTAALVLLFGMSAIIADVVRSRTQVALDRERIVGDTLQRAFLSGWDVVSYLRVGTAYVSAARHVAVGGDLFDVHSLDDQRCLLVVADVSGKGLDAAVDTAFVKFSLRALAEDYGDPSRLLHRFNASFMKSVHDETSFVSLFAGVLDAEAQTLRYASAGHSPVYLRRANGVHQLPVTGPLIGLRSEDEFPSMEEALLPDDLLVLATDGLTEARDTAGVMIDDAGAMRIIREAPRQPQELADYIVDAVTKTSGGRIADDLALLVIEFAPPKGRGAERALAGEGRTAPGVVAASSA